MWQSNLFTRPTKRFNIWFRTSICWGEIDQRGSMCYTVMGKEMGCQSCHIDSGAPRHSFDGERKLVLGTGYYRFVKFKSWVSFECICDYKLVFIDSKRKDELILTNW